MSVQAMNAVWAMDLRPAERLIALAFADHADASGGEMYPAIERVAWKTGYSLRHVQRLVRVLVRLGVLVADGSGPAGTVKYRLNFGAAARPAYDPAAAEGVTSATNDAGGVTPESSGGDSGVVGGVTPMSPESSINHQDNHHMQPSDVADEKKGRVITLSAKVLAEAGVTGRPLAELSGVNADLVKATVARAEELERKGKLKVSKAGFVVSMLRHAVGRGDEAQDTGEDYSGFVAQPAAVEPVRDIPAGPMTAWELVMEQARLQLHPDGFNALWKDLEMLEDVDGVMLVRINKTGQAAAYCLQMLTHPASGHCRMLIRLLRDCAGGRSVEFVTLDDYQRAAGD